MHLPAALALATLLASGSAFANDSMAELGAGGLVYVTTDAVQMKSEDLFISMDEVRVRYEFVNQSDKDVTSLVAFPMPDVTGSPEFMTVIPVDDPVNFLGFRTLVEGKPVEAKVQQRVSALGVDQTERLRSLGLPLAPHLAETSAAMDKLPPEKWDELIRLGLAAIDEFDAGKGWERHLAPIWTLSTTFYWEQTFPAGKTLIVEHSYRPSVGSSVAFGFDPPELLKEPWFVDHLAKYCMDKSFVASVRKLDARQKERGMLTEHRIDYILKTAANWVGTIENFRVVIDKGSPQNLVSFCGEGVKKTGPTTFEMRQENFFPLRDLSIAIVAPPGP